MKPFFLILALVLTAGAVRAQGRYYQYTFSVDTLVNVDNGTFLVPITLGDPAKYSFQIHAVQLSGTTASNAILQASNDAGTTWAAVDTLAFSGSASGFLTGSTISPKLRIYISQTGTSSTKYNVYAVLRKEN